MKKCNNPKCKSPNPQFNKNKNNKDGLSNRCKDCVRKSVKESYNKNKEYYIKDSIKRQNKNPKKYKEYQKQYREENKDKLKESYKQYYINNKEKYSEYSQRKDVIEKRKKRWKHRYYTDVSFRLKEILKANFHLFFKDKGKNKNLSFNSIIEYSYKDLKNHLESNFREGMNWDNFGELWEIHHIKPQSIFNIENINEIKECWELNNLIPLWKTTEISKQMGDITLGNRNVPKDEIYKP